MFENDFQFKPYPEGHLYLRKMINKGILRDLFFVYNTKFNASLSEETFNKIYMSFCS